MRLSVILALALFMLPALAQACIVLPTITAAEIIRLKEQANGGDVTAMDKLGYMYEIGNYEGGKQDYTEAITWWRKAIGKGDLEAEHRLAEKYEEGRGVAKDMTEAVKLYRDAANKDDYSSQLSMMVAYLSGQGEKKDLVRAYMWSLVSDKNPGRYPKDSRISDPYFTKEMTTEQRAEAKRLAGEWKPQPHKVAEIRAAENEPPKGPSTDRSTACD